MKETDQTAPIINPRKPVCLYPGCGFAARTRGLCPQHYAVAHSLVKSGRVTFARLEARGKVLPSNRRGATEQQRWFLSAKITK